MSNVVKYPFVNIQGKEARKVSYEKPGTFTPMEAPPKKVVVRDAAEVEEEIAMGLSLEDIFNVRKSIPIGGDDPEEESDDGFEEGIPATDLTEMFEEKREEAQAEADAIVASAREQATRAFHSWPFSQTQRTSVFEDGETSDGFILFLGDQDFARAGLTVARSLYPFRTPRCSQYGHPLPIRALFFTIASHSCPLSQIHRTLI